MKKEGKKFIIVDCKKNINIDNIYTFFSDLLETDYEEKGQSRIYYVNPEKKYNLENIMDTVNLDFNANVSVFESNVIYNDNDMNTLISLYHKYHQLSYSNISLLTLEIIRIGFEDINVIKPIILHCINKDTQLESVVLGMFDNNLNVSKTAHTVFMHRNTVINKLNYIKKETGLDLQNFTDAVVMFALIKRKPK
ncbi:MAG: helix-turn-helix domain-containing protein [Bacilli bacterium]